MASYAPLSRSTFVSHRLELFMGAAEFLGPKGNRAGQSPHPTMCREALMPLGSLSLRLTRR